MNFSHTPDLHPLNFYSRWNPGHCQAVLPLSRCFAFVMLLWIYHAALQLSCGFAFVLHCLCRASLQHYITLPLSCCLASAILLCLSCCFAPVMMLWQHLCISQCWPALLTLLAGRFILCHPTLAVAGELDPSLGSYCLKRAHVDDQPMCHHTLTLLCKPVFT